MIFYLALTVISAATLAYEVLLVRLFAIVQWHHFAFMAISIALLGFGASGTVLALWHDWARPRLTAIFASSAILFGLFAPASFAIAQALPFNPLAVIWDASHLLYLPVMYLLLSVPFFWGATCVGLAFICYGDQIGRIYACNLIGSAAGALGIVLILFVLSPSDSLRLIAVFGFMSATLVLLNKRSVLRPVLSAGSLMLALLTWTTVPDAWLSLQISEFKGLPTALKVSGAKAVGEYSGPLGLLTVIESPTVPFRYVPGLSLNAPTPPSRQLGVFVDGASMTAITSYDGNREKLAYLDYTTDAFAYHLVDQPSVLVLGSGGGRSVLQALYYHAASIDVVDIDSNMIRLVGQDYADEAGHIYQQPEVRVHVAKARGFVASAPHKWDLMQIPLLDSFGTSTAGVHGLSETYIYTVEALKHYIRHLRPDGWLSITRWLKLPPRDTLKLFATALEALNRLGVEDPEKQLVLVRGLSTTTLLVKNGRVTKRDIVRAKDFLQERSFDLCYYPGMGTREANRFNILDEPYFSNGANALVGSDRNTFVDHYKFDIAPTSDERPYFFDFLKWRTLPELLAIRKAGGAALLELGSLILVATLVQATVLSAALILVPLLARPSAFARHRRMWPVACYFLALGLAFLFVEIAFIQKFILFLSHPVYSVAVVLTAFLIFAGIGSAVSSRLAKHAVAWVFPAKGQCPRLAATRLSVVGIITVSLVYVQILPDIFEALLHLSDSAKIIISLGLIAPLAFCMGMPFPLGLSRVWSHAPSFVPWAWGINSCASVLSVLLATLTAMSFGFSSVIFIAAALYAGAAFAISRFPGPSYV